MKDYQAVINSRNALHCVENDALSTVSTLSFTGQHHELHLNMPQPEYFTDSAVSKQQMHKALSLLLLKIAISNTSSSILWMKCKHLKGWLYFLNLWSLADSSLSYFPLGRVTPNVTHLSLRCWIFPSAFYVQTHLISQYSTKTAKSFMCERKLCFIIHISCSLFLLLAILWVVNVTNVT